MRRPSGVADANRSGKVVKVVFGVDFFQSAAVFLHSQLVIVDGYFAD